LKNPTAVQDDFYTTFFRLWVFGFVLITEIVYQTFPGKDNAKIYVCNGKVPLDLIDVPIKMNWHIVIVAVFTVLLHIIYGIFQVLFKRYNQKKYNEFQHFKSQFGKVHTNEDLYVYLTAFVCAVTMILGVINVAMLEVISPQLLDTYPYYIMVYTMDQIQPSCVIIFTEIVFLLKQNKIRREVWQEITNYAYDLHH